MLFGTARAVPLPVAVDRPVLGGVGRDSAGAEARLSCAGLYAALEAPLFHGVGRIRESFSNFWKPCSSVQIKSKVKGKRAGCPLHTIKGRIKVKGDGQESPSHTIKINGGGFEVVDKQVPHRAWGPVRNDIG